MTDEQHARTFNPIEETRVPARFLNQLRTQRWDDHRYYHHSRINQSLHLLSALSFLVAYVLLFIDPAMAALLAWGVSMTARQAGHFFFEPRGYDHVNHATHEYKEEIKVGYNLRRKGRVDGRLGRSAPLALAGTLGVRSDRAGHQQRANIGTTSAWPGWRSV
jgi:hypothetical protein